MSSLIQFSTIHFHLIQARHFLPHPAQSYPILLSSSLSNPILPYPIPSHSTPSNPIPPHPIPAHIFRGVTICFKNFSSFQNIESVKSPVLVKDLCKYQIAEVCFGENHTTIMTEPGQVASMGSNNEGQLGCGNTKSRDVLTTVKGLEDEHVIVSKVLVFFVFYNDVVIACPFTSPCAPCIYPYS